MTEFVKVDKTAMRQWLAMIEERNGGVLRPADVVADAKSKACPFHNLFEWDDKVAAHQHRLAQARSIIRDVWVRVTNETRTIDVPYYVRDPHAEPKEQGYIALPRLRDSKESARAALALEFERAHSIMRRARNLAEALDLTSELDAVIASIETAMIEVR